MHKHIIPSLAPFFVLASFAVASMPPRKLTESQIIRLNQLDLALLLAEWRVDIPASCSVLMKRALLLQAMSGDLSVVKKPTESSPAPAPDTAALVRDVPDERSISASVSGEGRS